MFHKTVLALALLTSACAAKQAPTQAPGAADGLAPAAEAPAMLEESHFSRTPQGTISEAELQKILESPLQLELPSRVGVLPIIDAADWRGPGPSYEMVSPAMSQFAKSLPADDAFAQVTEMVPIPSGALGMEALREIAARYKLRYLLLYREHVDQQKRGNGWAAGYLTGVGALFLPGSTLSVEGYSEATLFDVKTGILLFTVRRRLEAEKRTNVWQRERKLGELQQRLALESADELAKDTRTALARLQEGVAAGIVPSADEAGPGTDTGVAGAEPSGAASVSIAGSP